MTVYGMCCCCPIRPPDGDVTPHPMASPAGVVRLLEQALEELYAKRSLVPLVDYVRGLADAPRDFLAVDRHTWGAVCQAASDWIARQALGAGTAAKQKVRPRPPFAREGHTMPLPSCGLCPAKPCIRWVLHSYGSLHPGGSNGLALHRWAGSNKPLSSAFGFSSVFFSGAFLLAQALFGWVGGWGSVIPLTVCLTFLRFRW